MKSLRNIYSWTLLFSLLAQIAVASAAPVLGKNKLPANGRQETLLDIPAFGRYSIMTQSDQGTALRYINKMSGPSDISGNPGLEDGRIDTFLDIGEYKIITYADDKGSGDVRLIAKPFIEVNRKTPPQLIEHKLVSTQLNDFEQRSYWIHVKKRQTVLLEAAGRSLGDLRLWRDGNWLLDTNPDSEIIEPEIGKPLTAQRLSADLNPGLYLLVAYGGETLPWAETSDAQPFHLRMGIPEIAANGIDRKITSPFGYDRWLVAASTDYYRLELQKNSPASITVAQFDRSYDFSNRGRAQSITKESKLPVAEVFTGKGNKANREVVTITAGAGLPYIFQRFSAVRHRVIRDPGTYWVSSLHSGYGEDSADATSVLTDRYKKEKYIDSRAIELTVTTGWQRRFNILDTLTLHFEIKQQGDYRVEADGIQGRFRFEPFTTSRSNNYKTPKARKLGDNWSLDRGFYILTIIPDSDARGVATLSVYAEGRKPLSASPAQISSRYKSVTVKRNHRYNLYLNQQPGVTSGILVRRYPIDLGESMPLTLSPDEKLPLRVSIPSQGELVAQSEDGSLATIQLKLQGSNQFISAKPGANRYTVRSGRYDLVLHNQSDISQNYQLQFTDASRLESTSLPEFDLNRVRLPNFPELNANEAQYLDLKKAQWTTFNVVVREPGLYKLESTGLLETQGNIRTRVITQLDQQVANGIGRNFLIQQYLREGEYQLALSPRGETRGHLGVQLSKTALIDGGRIEDGVAARYSLPSGEGLQYNFEVAQAGRYQLKSFGSNGFFSARLEDSDGWPLLQPGASADLDLELHAGKYRLVVLPTALPARVVTLLSRIEQADERKGHGPFAMDLNQNRYQHVWFEPAEGENRQPDSWTFELPAPAETRLSLSQGMEATLIALNSKTPALKFNSSKPFKQTLAAGQYRIEVQASRKNNRLDYSLGFSTKEQLVGQQRLITAPAEIVISIGRDSLIELSSYGQFDVKARLYDADDRLLASNDDRDNDWNFDIIESLPAGLYRLQVSPVGQPRAQTSIRLSEPETLAAQALTLPSEFKIDSPLIHSYTLDLSSQNGVFAVAAESRDSVSLSLEKRNSLGSWQSIAQSNGSDPILLTSIDNKADEGKDYRLKIWSPEQRGAEININARMLETSVVDEASIAQGLKPSSQALLSNQLLAANIGLKSPGMLKASPASTESLFWAGEKDAQLQAYSGFISSVDKVWLVGLKGLQPLQASRAMLEEQTLQFNVDTTSPVWIDTSSDKPYSLIVAESRVGFPGIAVVDGDQYDARQMGTGFGSSIALIRSSDKARVRAWDSGNSGAPLPVKLQQYGFSRPYTLKLKAGSTDATILSKSALSFGLSGKLQDIQFNLAQGVAAVLLKKGEILRSFWSDRQDQNYQVWSDADALLMFNTSTVERVLNIKLNDVEQLATVSQAQLFKRHFPYAGIFTLAISSDNQVADFVQVYGDETELLIQNRQGRVYRGQQVPLSDDAVLDVRHGVGLVTVWISNNKSYAANTNGKTTSMPAQTPLKGPKQTIELTRDKAGFISLKSPSALIATIQRNGLPEQIQIFETGLKTTLFLPPGANRLLLESTSSQDMKGLLYLAEVTPVPLQEGLGNQVALQPGDSRVYHFSLTQSQEIGIGVQASMDVAQAYLINQQGQLLGKGVSQKHSLPQGLYYLMVELPAKVSAGVELRPAIVGIESRDTGASKQIMLDYQQYSSPEAL